MTVLTPRGTVEVLAPAPARGAELLTPDALGFVALLHDTFAGRRAELLTARRARTAHLLAGEERLGFSDRTAWIRDDATWRVPPPPPRPA